MQTVGLSWSPPQQPLRLMPPPIRMALQVWMVQITMLSLTCLARLMEINFNYILIRLSLSKMTKAVHCSQCKVIFITQLHTLTEILISPKTTEAPWLITLEVVLHLKNCSITLTTQKCPLTTTIRCLRMFKYLTIRFKQWTFLSTMEEHHFQTM